MKVSDPKKFRKTDHGFGLSKNPHNAPLNKTSMSYAELKNSVLFFGAKLKQSLEESKKMKNIKEILMERDELDENEAEEIIAETKK